MHLDLSDLPQLGSALVDLVEVVRAVRASDSPGGKRITKTEAASLIRAVGAVIISIADVLL